RARRAGRAQGERGEPTARGAPGQQDLAPDVVLADPVARYINRRLARSSGGSRPRVTSLASTYVLYAARISALPTDLSPQRRNFGAFFESERPNMSSAAGYHLLSSRCASARPRASLTISARKR